MRACTVKIKYNGKWEKCEGIFHQWGWSYEEFEYGVGNFSTAIVELGSGAVIEVIPENVIFHDPLREEDIKK